MSLFGRKQHAPLSTSPPAAPVTPPAEASDAEVGKAKAGVSAASAALCPYCGAELIPPPQASKMCPYCGQKMHLKLRAGTEERRLMTEVGSMENDLASDALRTASRLRTSYYMLTDVDWRRAENSLTRRFGRTPPAPVVAWRAATQKIPRLTRQRDWQGLSGLYQAMARQLYDEGRNHFELARKAANYKLLSLQRVCSEVEMVSGFVNNGCDNECGHCSSEEKVMPLALALEKMPIPRPDCRYHIDGTHHEGQSGWCLCSYSAKLPGDKKEGGRPMRKLGIELHRGEGTDPD